MRPYQWRNIDKIYFKQKLTFYTHKNIWKKPLTFCDAFQPHNLPTLPFFQNYIFSQRHFLANTSYTFAIPLDFLPSWHSLLLEYFDIAVWHYTLVHKHADKTRKNASSSPQATCHSLPYLIRHLLEYNIYIYKFFILSWERQILYSLTLPRT